MIVVRSLFYGLLVFLILEKPALALAPTKVEVRIPYKNAPNYFWLSYWRA